MRLINKHLNTGESDRIYKKIVPILKCIAAVAAKHTSIVIKPGRLEGKVEQGECRN